MVRKYDDDSLKAFRYEYLVGDDGQIPTLDPGELESYGMPFPSGTRFVHIAYELGRLNSRWSLVGYRYFDNLLFDPVLPYRIEDRRVSPAFNRNLYGARNRLDQVNPARRHEAQNYDVDLARWGGEGRARIRYWVFRPTGDSSEDPEDERGVRLDSYLDSSNSPRTIMFTLNGQRHHAQEKRIVREERLAALADYLLMHVDCDGLSRRLKKEIFPATRAGATAGERREDLLLQAVRYALSDPWLKQKMEEVVRRRQEQITDESTRRVQRMLDQLISVYRTEQDAGGQRGSNAGGTGRTGRDERHVHDPPQSLRFADHRPLEIQSGLATTVYLLTDGPDDLLRRRQRRGQLNVLCDGDEIASFDIAEMQMGRVPVHVQVPGTMPSGRRARMIATLEVEPATYLTDTRHLRVVPPPRPYLGTEPPTRFEFARNTPLTIEAGRKASAEVHTDARNDILDRAVNPGSIQASCDIPGVFVAVRGPRNGVASAEALAAPDTQPEAEGALTVTLSFEDGTTFMTSRPCKVTPTRERRARPGVQTAPVPAYHITRVWRVAPENLADAVTWTAFANPWNDDKIGVWELNGEELYLYVNMDERQFRTERSRLTRRFGDGYTQRLTDRYVAYLAFHLFQLHEQSQAQGPQHGDGENADNGEGSYSGNDIPYDPDGPVVSGELGRVASAIIQTLRSEAELLRLEAETNDQS